jgi:transposase
MLFEDLPEMTKPSSGVVGLGRPRLREPRRDEILLRPVDLDSLIGDEHPARLYWDYVCKLDLSELEKAIKSREGRPGHPAASPQLLLALWLYATSEGVGSARALAELCENHDAYRWLCGGVSVNYHTLSDFRTGHGALLDRLLTENVAALAAEGLINLSAISHDGMRVRASAGAASFRRKKTIEEHLAQAREMVERLKREVDEAPDASRSRIRAARERAARERAERLAAALAKHAEIETKACKQPTSPATAEGDGEPEPDGDGTPPRARAARRKQERQPAVAENVAASAEAACAPADDATTASTQTASAKKEKKEKKEKEKEPRVSTTDPQARVIKMADGGFRPGYNCQISTARGTLVIVGVDVSTNSSDRGLLKPAITQMEERYGMLPKQCLADGGFAKNDDIEWAASQNVEVFCPPPNSKPGVDPCAPRADDGVGVATWRERMKSEAGKETYKDRSITECAHAHMRERDLWQFIVRGEEKVKAQLTIHALAHNIKQGENLRRKRKEAAAAAAA